MRDYKGIKSLIDEDSEEPSFVAEKFSPVKKLRVPRGMILESDVLVIFYNLTGKNFLKKGHKNFDNSEKIKSQFDKNIGMKVSIDTNHNVYTTLIDPSKSFKINHENCPLKMDFCLFIKSFEYVSKKLHPDVNLDHAFSLFLEKDIKKLTSKRKDQLFIDKKVITDKWNSLKRDEIVINLIKF